MNERLVAGRYRLHDTRATGGMAAIWRATDEQSGDHVAVKLLHPHLVRSDDARARLEREGAVLGAISHPNVVAVRAVILDDEAPAVVMEYVAGASLAERLAGDGPMGEEEALGVALDVTEALRAVHAVGLVHRDLKPGNIILGDDGRTRLIDFGIAADIEAVAEMTALTATDDVIGTLRYLAPERLAGEPATPSTDLWGVGAVLFEMVAGRPAYPSATIVERVSTTEATPARPEGIGDATWAVIGRTMATDPATRPADASELAAVLRGVRAELAAPQAQVGDPWADTMTMALPAGAIATVAERPGTIPEAAIPQARPPARDRRGLMAAVGAVGLAAVIVVAAALAGPTTDDVVVAAPTIAPAPSPTALPVSTAQPVDDDDRDGADEADDVRPKGNGKANGQEKGKGKGNDKGD